VALALVAINPPGKSEPDLEAPLVQRTTVSGRVWGDPAAPVRMVIFEDFQCPFCARFTHDIEGQLGTEFIETGRASLEYRYMTFIGAESVAAAQAAECASRQNAFWPYHDLLYRQQGRENSGAFSAGVLRSLGEQVGTLTAGWNQAEFEGCLEGLPQPAIEADAALAQELGVRSTPTLFINGEPLVGVPSMAQLRDAIAAARP
jgi:protein-disulfide isomerase